MKKILLLVVTLGAMAACGDNKSGNNGNDAAPRDAAVDTTDGPDAPDCFTGTPTTNDEIINACTPDSVVKIYKDSHPPLLNADGSLPPLP
ncbi:MAG TPA: hypothetical protein VGM39_22245 [Kofleriaceae bacterium]|jgi:hypothetical protein